MKLATVWMALSTALRCATSRGILRWWAIGTRSFQLDICAPEWKLIIEFDGRFWHRKEFERDRRKICYLEEYGWTVNRIRDHLKPVTVRDVVVDSRSDSVPTMVKSVLRRLQELNFTTPKFDRYLSEDRLWAEREANRWAQAERNRSLLGEHPGIAWEIDETRNHGLRPQDLHPGSNRRVTWRCSTCNHLWEATVSARVGRRGRKGTGCPKCAGAYRGELKRAPLPGQSLADLHPEVAAQWDHEKNTRPPDSYRPFSMDSVWWTCPVEGYSYKAAISSRTSQGSGCPVCDGKQVLTGVNDLATTHAELLKLWDHEKNRCTGLYPEEIMAGSAKKAYWLCAMCGAVGKPRFTRSCMVASTVGSAGSVLEARDKVKHHTSGLSRFAAPIS